jgi:hypothetical protein
MKPVTLVLILGFTVLYSLAVVGFILLVDTAVRCC